MAKFATLVEFFVVAIERGSYRPGDTLPSLRATCATQHVSMTTAKRAYHELERRGFIEALPRAGFRVVAGSVPSAAQPPLAAWGSPFVNPALFDGRALARAAARALVDYPAALAGLDAAGFVPLRRQLAQRYRAQGVALDWDQLIVTCGAMEALTLAVQLATRGGPARLAVVVPAFPGLLGLLAQWGIAVLPLGLDANGELDLALLEREAAAGRVAGVAVMPTFQHPTGQCLSETQQHALLDLAERHQLPIIEDDSYRELVLAERAPPPIKALDREGRVLYCAGSSKALAPGYRVGWLAAGRWHEAALQLKQSQTLASPLPSQLALAELLAGHGEVAALASLRTALAKRLGAMRALLVERLPAGCGVSRPAGGYFLWLTLPTGFDIARLQQAALAVGIHFAPGELCYPPGVPVAALRLNASYYEPQSQADLLGWLADEIARLASGAYSPMKRDSSL
ncbi:PLP-dependent aminotransferase family protein [Crenobacter sp. SG2305]|uniref:aminotransferase-like domain-containing protein n=1 Tax=Crenobacter oryzisoli TaxID=3056844 RepID=UPI0025AA93C2|nr:PLP-dependent aminotransferase family protein [Crenobacter sp. SG2305]MDN0081274.1 PLP-dependent aminotransferase family protein [Crenobacter sp. SG2305]